MCNCYQRPLTPLTNKTYNTGGIADKQTDGFIRNEGCMDALLPWAQIH